jgi:hypothetical protein
MLEGTHGDRNKTLKRNHQHHRRTNVISSTLMSDIKHIKVNLKVTTHSMMRQRTFQFQKCQLRSTKSVSVFIFQAHFPNDLSARWRRQAGQADSSHVILYLKSIDILLTERSTDTGSPCNWPRMDTKQHWSENRSFIYDMNISPR